MNTLAYSTGFSREELNKLIDEVSAPFDDRITVLLRDAFDKHDRELNFCWLDEDDFVTDIHQLIEWWSEGYRKNGMDPFQEGTPSHQVFVDFLDSGIVVFARQEYRVRQLTDAWKKIVAENDGGRSLVSNDQWSTWLHFRQLISGYFDDIESTRHYIGDSQSRETKIRRVEEIIQNARHVPNEDLANLRRKHGLPETPRKKEFPAPTKDSASILRGALNQKLEQ